MICLKGWSQTNSPVGSSTGEILKSDTSKVIIPIKYLRDANAKLIERIYLIKINTEQDSIIKLNKQYTIEQDKIIKDFQNRVIILNENNTKLFDKLNKQKSTTSFFKGLTAAGIVAVIVVSLLK